MIKFGTGGWRDIIGEKFTFDNVRRFAQGVVEQIKEERMCEQGVVIGYDNRFMAEEFAIAAAEVFAGNEIKVILLTPSVPTPLVNFVTRETKAAAGLTITASHNPYIYNGIKFVSLGGQPAMEDATIELERRINQINSSEVNRLNYDHAYHGGWIVRENYTNEFVDFVKAQIDMDIIRQTDLRILYDSMFGTGVNPLLTLLIEGRCYVQQIHDKSDPLFGGRVPAPTEQTLWRLIGMMKESSYDIGIATDGDGDRIAVVDEDGNYIDANEILVILYYYSLEYRQVQGHIVRNISTTHVLDEIAEEYGYKCYETPVGFKYIAEKMVETNAVLGGESSGGITFRGHLMEKDAILSAGVLLEMMANTKKTLKEIRTEIKQKFGKRYFNEYNYSYGRTSKEEILKKIKMLDPKLIHQDELFKYKEVDGFKWEWADGTWCLIRFSGTEPLLRITVETYSERMSEVLIERMKSALVFTAKN